ncbi:hypothetical protein Tco_0210859, partial [Tanacetum coccineum]
MTLRQHICGALDGLQSLLLLLRVLPLLHHPVNVETTFPNWVRSFELSSALLPLVMTESLKLPEVSLFRRICDSVHESGDSHAFRCSFNISTFRLMPLYEVFCGLFVSLFYVMEHYWVSDALLLLELRTSAFKSLEHGAFSSFLALYSCRGDLDLSRLNLVKDARNYGASARASLSFGGYCPGLRYVVSHRLFAELYEIYRDVVSRSPGGFDLFFPAASLKLGFSNISLATVSSRSGSLVGQGSTCNRVCGREYPSAVRVYPRSKFPEYYRQLAEKQEPK